MAYTRNLRLEEEGIELGRQEDVEEDGKEEKEKEVEKEDRKSI